MKKMTEKDMKDFLASIEERVDACCDRHVAEILKEVIFEEAQEKFEENVLPSLQVQINSLINKKFS